MQICRLIQSQVFGSACTRDDQEIRGKRLPFLHLLTNRAEKLAHTTATHMQLICHSMNYVSRLRPLQLSSRQCYIA